SASARREPRRPRARRPAGDGRSVRARVLHRAPEDPDPLPDRRRRRPHAAAPKPVRRAYRMVGRAAGASVRQVRPRDDEVQEDRDDRPGLGVRPRELRRVPADLRRSGWPGRSEALAAVGTTDFAPYITGLKRDVDAIYFAGAGNDALRFARQYQDAGLK